LASEAPTSRERNLVTEIPEWPEAEAAFREFLVGHGYAGRVRWVFRDEIYQPNPVRMIAVRRSVAGTTELAVKVFGEGRAKGLVEIAGLAQSDDRTLATVWFPKYPGEEVQGWTRGLKLTVRSPLARASIVSTFTWAVIMLLPSYRRYQAAATFIGSRKWAAR
jgi:hypothetical protein